MPFVTNSYFLILIFWQADGCNPLIFQTWTILSDKMYTLNYLRSVTFGIRKLEKT